jgi:peptidylprolyl isomerase
MKLLPTLRVRGFVIAAMLAVVLSIGTMTLTFSAPTTNAPSAPPAPASEIDKETGKPIVTTPSGLQYVDLVVGKGAAVKTGDHIFVNYVGTLVDGTKFDSSYDRGQPFDFIVGIGQVIKGWDEGLLTMNVGGKRKLIIPSRLGYGMEGQGDVIPANATLIFKVELVSVGNPK